MKITNCLVCCIHWDNRRTKYHDSVCTRHCFSIPEKIAKKYDWSIEYIKKEHRGGRHIIASLGSAGFTDSYDVRKLVNYAYSKGDRDFHDLILTETLKELTPTQRT